MANFDLFLPILLENEGYWSNNKSDSGGKTWRGISENNNPNWEGWSIIKSYEKDPDFPHILRSDFNLAKLVYVFYKTNYWNVFLGDQINNQSIANFIGDWGINAGLNIPIKHSQQILGVCVDGKMGPTTLNALNSTNGPEFFLKLQQARLDFYKAVIAAHSTDEQFWSNWYSRTESFSYKA